MLYTFDAITFVGSYANLTARNPVVTDTFVLATFPAEVIIFAYTASCVSISVRTFGTSNTILRFRTKWTS